MMINEIATKQDLKELEERILKGIKEELALINANTPTAKIDEDVLRTRDVLKILKISENKLKDMRFKEEILSKKIGGTYFYSLANITEMLNKNLTPFRLK